MFKTIFEMLVPFYLVGCDQEFEENNNPCENDNNIDCCVTHVNLAEYINKNFSLELNDASKVIKETFSERIVNLNEERANFLGNVNSIRSSGKQLSKEEQIKLKQIEIDIVNEEAKIKEEVNLMTKDWTQQIKEKAIKEISDKAKEEGYKYVLNTDNINQPVLYAE